MPREEAYTELQFNGGSFSEVDRLIHGREHRPRCEVCDTPHDRYGPGIWSCTVCGHINFNEVKEF